MQSGKLLYTLQDYTGRPTTVTYAPDSKTAVSGDYNGRAFLWDIQSGSLLHTFRAHTSAVSDIAYSPDGRTLLTSGDGKVILWELYSGVQLHTWQAHGEVKATDGIRSIAYSPDGNTVLAGYLNNTTFLWDIKTGNLLHSLKGSIVAYSPDGKTLLTVGPAMLWDMQSGTLLHTLSNPGTWSRAYSPDGKTILIGCDNGLSLLWDVHSGALLHKLPGLTGIVENVAYSPDGTMALTAPVYISNGGPALLWDVQNGTFLRPLCPLALGKVWLYTGWILCFTSGIVALFYLRQAISITSNKKRKTLHYKLLNCHLLKWRLN
jgi:WD40 repeat protein